MLDAHEAALTADRRARGAANLARFEHVLCDVRDRGRMETEFARAAPDVVVHLAAYKHVDWAERYPEEFAATNLDGSWNVLRCAEAGGAGTVVVASTDKAARHASQYGRTKRLMEGLAGVAAERTGARRARCASSTSSVAAAAPPSCSCARPARASRSPSPTRGCCATGSRWPTRRRCRPRRAAAADGEALSTPPIPSSCRWASWPSGSGAPPAPANRRHRAARHPPRRDARGGPHRAGRDARRRGAPGHRGDHRGRGAPRGRHGWPSGSRPRWAARPRARSGSRRCAGRACSSPPPRPGSDGIRTRRTAGVEVTPPRRTPRACTFSSDDELLPHDHLDARPPGRPSSAHGLVRQGRGRKRRPRPRRSLRVRSGRLPIHTTIHGSRNAFAQPPRLRQRRRC